MSYSDFNATELVKHWRKIVNDNISLGRDAHMLKDFLEIATSVQILYGFYQYKGIRTISIPQFLKQSSTWLEDDEQLAAIELARCITASTPKEYYVYQDLKEDDTSWGFNHASEARQFLRNWAERVLN